MTGNTGHGLSVRKKWVNFYPCGAVDASDSQEQADAINRAKGGNREKCLVVMYGVKDSIPAVQQPELLTAGTEYANNRLRWRLEQLHERMLDPDNWNCDGICINCVLDDVVYGPLADELEDILADTFRILRPDKPPRFPVPGGEDAYFGANSQNMWDWETSEYAEGRWQLLEEAIEYLGGDYTDRSLL